MVCSRPKWSVIGLWWRSKHVNVLNILMRASMQERWWWRRLFNIDNCIQHSIVIMCHFVGMRDITCQCFDRFYFCVYTYATYLLYMLCVTFCWEWILNGAIATTQNPQQLQYHAVLQSCDLWVSTFAEAMEFFRCWWLNEGVLEHMKYWIFIGHPESGFEIKRFKYELCDKLLHSCCTCILWLSKEVRALSLLLFEKYWRSWIPN
jgi:hypothetical protein